MIKPLDIPYVIIITTKIFMLVVLRVKKSSSMSMEEFFFKPKAPSLKPETSFPARKIIQF
jgi:hypothetical protein